MRSLVALVLLVGVATTACAGGGRREVTGVVVSVDGDLTAVRSFELLTAEGETLRFTVAPGVTFDGGPVSHLSAHVASGEPVRVGYEEQAGTFVVVSITDA